MQHRRKFLKFILLAMCIGLMALTACGGDDGIDPSALATQAAEKAADAATAVAEGVSGVATTVSDVADEFNGGDEDGTTSTTEGAGGTVTEEVAAPAPPAAAISVSAVSGNTASLGAAAEFVVKLENAPSADVSISVASSNEAEGVPEQSELTFTADNWFIGQLVTVRGTNETVQNGGQDYQIVLGSAVSADSRYSGLDPDDVAMRGIELTLSEPDNLKGIIANTAITIPPTVTYTGNKRLSFALTQHPEGMTIDLTTGVIEWTPQEADEGQSYAVGVSVNDGAKFEQTAFQIAVAQPEPIATEVNGNVLTVVDPSTDLNGMTITQIEGATGLDQLQIGTLPIDQAPERPEWVVPISDVFVVKGSYEQEIELRMPLNDLPENVSFDDVRLHAYVEAFDADGLFWSPVSIETDYEGTAEEPVIVIKLGGLEGLAFWSYSVPEAQDSSNASPHIRAIPLAKLAAQTSEARTVTCTQQVKLGRTIDTYVCTSSDNEDVKITVTGWGNQTKRWTTVTIEESIGWVLDSQAWFKERKLGFNNEFSIAIEPMSYLGYVTTGRQEKRNTLHITDDNSNAAALMQATYVHEYFHHAQGHPDTQLDNQKLVIDVRASWLTEGTAQWFEDEINDSTNSYTFTESPGYRIGEAGINSATDRSYQRFGFFKLLTSQCANFSTNIQSSFNMLTTDSAVANLTAKFGSEAGDYNCNFGAHLGSDNQSTLAAALAYYNYATQLENKMALLDSNETGVTFPFRQPTATFTNWQGADMSSWSNSAATPATLSSISNVPAVGAYSFKVPAISGSLPAGKVAALTIESDKAIIVSITSKDSNFAGTTTIGTDNHQHTWFDTAKKTSYIYDAEGSVPELFVTLVNSSLTDAATITNISFQIRDEFSEETPITSHANNAQVDLRVVPIAGQLSAEAASAADKVVVTVNGIATDATLSADGSYSVKSVMALGQNIVKAQAFNGDTPVAKENVITITGVANSGTGRNALLASQVVYVLRWDSANTDVDIYTTNKLDETIWYSSEFQNVGTGTLDFDVTGSDGGFGPEVVSYRAGTDDVYVNGTFAVDVHYYEGSVPTNFTLDVILNETDGANLRVLRFDSTVALPGGNSSQDEPTGSGDSRFNDILKITCSAERVCSLGDVDSTKITQASSAK